MNVATAPRNADDAYIQRIFWLAALAWTGVLVALALWNASQTYSATFGSARASAVESFHKDVIYRRWASMHGGVYVPVTPQSPPNPDLAGMPERDIQTPSGKQLTLVNPAYMTRQAHELGNKDTGSRGHITSLNPLRPANAPDAWESQSLQSFERGAKEATSLEPIDGEMYFRFMRPLVTEQACLKCHEMQGYKLNDVRGGISASIPWAPYDASFRTQIYTNLMGYLAIWTMGGVGLLLGRRQLLRNLMQRLQGEEALRNSNEELKTLNAQLAQSQSQLLQSEKLAAVGQLAAGVAHEINNPIGFVRSNLGTLKDYVEGLIGLVAAYESQAHAAIAAARTKVDIAFIKEDAPVLLAESREGLDRVSVIVQNLRDFSHIDSAQWQDADLLAGLDSTLNVAKSEIKSKAEVIKQYSKLPAVRCNPGQINQVFLNLIMNAIQAIDDKGTITLSSGQEAGWVWISIEDTGIGMAPDVLQRIFDPFFTTKPVGKGTGLGLSVSYDIVKKHGGRIDVRSEPGKGTRFCVWLPA